MSTLSRARKGRATEEALAHEFGTSTQVRAERDRLAETGDAYVEAAGWYRRCLEDIQDAGYDSALAAWEEARRD